MHFVREKRDKPPASAFMRGRVPLSPLFYRRCSIFTAKFLFDDDAQIFKLINLSILGVLLPSGR
jgi:hypothetical protein